MFQITPNVYVNTEFTLPLPSRGSNNGFVVTKEGIVMIDTPMLPSYAVKWREEIAKKGEVRYLINTEHHTDHIAGNYFFSSQPIVSSQGVRDMFSASIEDVSSHERRLQAVEESMDVKDYILWRWRDMDPEGMKFAPDFQPAPPPITFTEKLTLYVGDHTFELMSLPGHSPYQIGVYVPEEKVIFTGDNFIYGWQSSMAHCYPKEWIESLNKIEAMDVEFIVPGHGPNVGNKADLREYKEFIQMAIDTVQDAIDRGISKEEAAATISFEDEEHRPARHPGAEQQRMNVVRLYDMLTK